MPPLQNLDIDPKAPGDAVFVTFNLAPYLNSGATVSSATWSAPGVTVGTTSTTSTTATAKISGGIHGQDYAVTVTAITSDAETLVFTGRLRVRDGLPVR